MVPSPALQFIIVLLLSSVLVRMVGHVVPELDACVIFAAAIDRMLPEWVSRIEPRTKTPINALLLMVIPSVVVSYLYAYNIFKFQTLALDATVVIAITFFGSTIAATIMPWRSKDVFDGSPIAKYKVPSWLGWIVMLLYAVFAIYLIVISFQYAGAIMGALGGTESRSADVVCSSCAGNIDRGQCRNFDLDCVLRWTQSFRGRTDAFDHAGGLGLPRLPRLAAGLMVLGSNLRHRLARGRNIRHRLVERQLDGVHVLHVHFGLGHLLWLQFLSPPPGY